MSQRLPTLRPRDFASLMLGSEQVAPRQRAREQQSDRAGMLLKHQVLSQLRDADPRADQLEECLATIVERMGEPSGPTRAIAQAVLEEWHMFQSSPDWAAYLLDEAISHNTGKAPRHGQQLPG